MPVLLAITVSPRHEFSASRLLTEHFIQIWQRQHPGGDVRTVDLAKRRVSFIDGDWIDAAFTRAPDRTELQQRALQESDELISDITAADHIVIGTPMYNFGVPASLKAYLDQIVRIGATYTRGRGLLPDRPVTVICASRDVYTPGTDAAARDHLTPNLADIFEFIGITSLQSILVGDSLAVRDGKVTFEDHLAEFAPLVAAAARSDDVP